LRLLLDTHVLLWAAAEPAKLSAKARELLDDPANTLLFSAASLWEIAIKRGLDRPDFTVEPAQFRRGLIENGYIELPITSAHAVATLHLPALHKDPFDRLLLAQALVESITLVTADEMVARYPGSILPV
jgi:PIN domain nuclease of toxin-antitoxin system